MGGQKRYPKRGVLAAYLVPDCFFRVLHKIIRTFETFETFEQFIISFDIFAPHDFRKEKINNDEKTESRRVRYRNTLV
jgi:hypothetical protein